MPAPPPVPALPDTLRQTSYSPSASIGPFNVNFALYGDGTDYGNWIDVTLNDVVLVAGVDYTLTSPTGTLGVIPLPITDAQITLTVAGTGTLVITGDRRPRRPNQFAENRGVPARDLNVVITDIVATLREAWDFVRTRALIAPPGEVMAFLPNIAARANRFLTFDAFGNPVASLFTFLGVLYYNQINDGTVSSGTATINVSAGPWHRLTAAGSFTLALTGWPAAPTYAEVEIELINGGIGTITFPAVNWLRGDGTSSPFFSSLGVVLQNPGTNWIFVWSRDGGATVWGRAV